MADPAERFYGIACDHGGRPVVGWSGRGGAAQVAALDEAAAPLWSCDLSGLTGHARLSGSASGVLLLVTDPHVNRLHVIDGVGGRLMYRLEGADPAAGEDPPEASHPLCVKGHHGIAVDPGDLSFVVLVRGPGCREPALMRFRKDGHALPLWGKRRRSRRSSVISLIMGPDDAWQPPSWDEVTDKLLVPPAGAHMTIGADGLLYLVSPDLRQVVAWSRDGAIHSRRELDLPVDVTTLETLIGAADGTLYAAIRLDHAGGPHAHVLRVPATGRPEVWLGPRSDNPAPLGRNDVHLAVNLQGSLLVAGGLSSLRIFDDMGLLRWRSAATEAADAERSD